MLLSVQSVYLFIKQQVPWFCCSCTTVTMMLAKGRTQANVTSLADASYHVSKVSSDRGSGWCSDILPAQPHRKSPPGVTCRVTVFSLPSVLCRDHFSFQPELV